MTAEIHDRGYRRYEGERTGVTGAFKTLITHSAQRCLGLHRSARHKIIPFLIIGLAFVPAIVFVGLSVLLPGEIAAEIAPPFSGYFGNVSVMMFLFIGFIAPILLCQDRRSGMLGIYPASPLDRTSYLVAKSAAITVLMMTIALLPNLVYFLAVTLQGFGPGGIGESLKVLAQMLIASMVIAAYYTSVGMAVSSTTDRQGAATAIILGLFVGSSILANTLVNGLDMSSSFRLGDLISTPIELAPRVFGEEGGWTRFDNPTWSIWTAVLGTIVACQAFVWYRYQKILVQR